MYSQLLSKSKTYISNKDNLTLWMNNLLVVYTFFLPISQSFKATVFVYILLIFFIRGDVVSHIKNSLQNKVVKAFLYFFLIYVVGLLWTDDISNGLSNIKSIKYGLYLIIFYCIVDGRYINKVISAFIIGMLISEVTSYGMLLEIMPWSLDVMGIHFYAAQTIGDPSPFLNHIHYGVALAFVVLLLAQKIVYSNNTILIKVLMSIFVITATMNIFLTGGRTGYVTFALLIIIIAMSYLKKYSILLLVGICIIFTLAYNSSPLFKDKVDQSEKNIVKLFEKEPDFTTSIGQRAGLVYYGYQVAIDNLLLGAGTGDSMNEIKKLAPLKYTAIQNHEHEHNQFLHVFISLGIVGLLIFLNIYYQIFTFKQKDKELQFIMIFATLAVTFGVLTTQFNLRFFMPLWIVMLAITLIDKERFTINNLQTKDTTINLQIIAAIAIFSINGLLQQLL